MKKLTLILALFCAVILQAQTVKYVAYEFNSYDKMVRVLENDGFTFPQPVPMDCQLLDTLDGTTLDFHYIGEIITNYPITDSTWQPVYSSNVYCISAKKGDSKIKNKFKVTGQLRKYIHEYIAKFSGEKNTY